MKKIIGIILILFVICITAFSIWSRNRTEYFEGKDSVASFGNGEYQIIKGPDKKLLLSNEKYHGFLLNDVLEYTKIKKNLYVLGSLDNVPVFINVDLNTNHVRYHILIEKDNDSLYYNGKEKMIKEGVIIFHQDSTELTNDEKEILSNLKEKNINKE